VSPRRRGDLGAAKHAGELVDTLLGGQGLDLGQRGAARGAFLHPQLRVCLGRDLGQVGHAEHLSVGAETAQQAADDLGDAAADADIDLVEHQCRDASDLGSGHLNGEADA